MRSPGFAWLAITAAALSGLLAVELGQGGGAEDMSSPAAARLPTAPIESANHAAPQPTSEWVATILARPLFSPDRRPPPPPEVSVAPMATPDDALPRLAGVLVSPDGKTAIFDGPAGSKPIVLHEGGRIGAFVVEAIEPGQVTLRGPAGTNVLHPVFGDGAAEAAPPAPAPSNQAAGAVAPAPTNTPP
jgi:hypothetical protein